VVHADGVTDQPWNDAARPDPPAQQPPGYPPGYPPLNPQYPQYGGPPPYYDPAAPFGRHPVTGQPFSDKSKTTAGLLQLLSLVGIGGIGRFYLGDIGIGVAQLLLGWFTCGIGLVWSVIDAILILTDKVPDSSGRPLRDGT
jgi:TM2 domain-containing membrane protein YozV